MLVPDSATPLYLQLEEILRQEILSGSRRRATNFLQKMNWWNNIK